MPDTGILCLLSSLSFVLMKLKCNRYMRNSFFLLAFIILSHWPALSQTIWEGPKITFTKPNNADHTLAENQDRITDAVWITRATSRGIFNIKTESSYVTNSSPSDTEWAFGATAELQNLVFDNWQTTVGSNPPAMVDRDMVLHLISENIYIDIKFLSWSVSSAGGGFSYERSTDISSGIGPAENFSGVISIFPNPSTQGTMNIRCESKASAPVEVSVFDVSGKLFFSESFSVNPVRINDWRLDLSRFGKGAYFVKLSQGAGQVTQKIVLK